MLAICKTLRFSHHGGTVDSCLWIEVAQATRDDSCHDMHWDSVEDLIIRAAEGVQARGELLVVGPGPHPQPDGPAVLLGTSTISAWTSSVVSASPVPGGSRWGESGAEGDRVTLTATMSSFARVEAAELTIAALREWGVAPFDVGIGFVIPIERLMRAG
ncbi:hypothetical protein [Gordonia rhizosphera]|uniref:Uncharacterized protein n=1 Tax=Gordonia rhizosphera NBRC 16068 TaxID=1108045 RepID=K6WLN4_9ACTN|nr:hypothetical protein [Gordonia rhizosphera]GAB93072.1 hypothetical protein GORHZ_205_00140 [Gordonia rhizosphera NBRC 16068]